MKSLNDIKKYILKEYKYRTELHAHTLPVSTCADFSAEEVVKTYADLGFDSVAITNHYTFEYRMSRFNEEPGAELFTKWYLKDFRDAKKAGEKYGINVILGAEIRFEENHNDYLVYGINQKILEKIYDALPKGIAEFKKNEALKDVLIIQAHPNRNGMTDIDSSYIDGMEVFNMHSGHNGRNAKTIKRAKEDNLKVLTIGSDYHHEGGAGICAIRTKKPIKDTYELSDVLRKGDYVFDIYNDVIILP